MKNLAFLLGKFLLFLFILFLFYSYTPFYEDFKMSQVKFPRPELSSQYSQCFTVPYSNIEQQRFRFTQTKLVLKDLTLPNELLNLQLYDLCMRRLGISIPMVDIKRRFIFRQRAFLQGDQENISSLDFNSLLGKLRSYYPDYRDRFRTDEIQILISSMYRLQNPDLIYLCLAQQQLKNEIENECFIYERREDLINKITSMR